MDNHPNHRASRVTRSHGDQFSPGHVPGHVPGENQKETDRSRASKIDGASDQFEGLVMFEGGAAAKCVRPSWISHRSPWRTAT